MGLNFWHFSSSVIKWAFKMKKNFLVFQKFKISRLVFSRLVRI